MGGCLVTAGCCDSKILALSEYATIYKDCRQLENVTERKGYIRENKNSKRFAAHGRYMKTAEPISAYY
jgi:hypothetical protein